MRSVSVWRITFFLVAQTLCAAAEQPQASRPETDPDHAAKMAKGLELFKQDVRQVLVGRCLKCHGGEQTEAELDLSSRQSLLEGGSQGPAVNIGTAESSRLYRLVAHLEEPHMPEDGAKLDDRLIAAIAEWIQLGAPYDKPLLGKEEDPLAWTKRKVDESARQFWSFLPLADVQPPRLQDDHWSRTKVDRFVLARLRQHGLAPNDSASRRKLIRRAYFDLLGLPPTPEDVERFIADEDPKAYEQLIDRLLQNEHYGERWGRHWLDVARFAESHGFEQDYDRPHAYHYRDFVIKALNADMPFDQFVRWQLAGDEIVPDEPLAMMATGFLGAGVFPTQLTEKEFETARYDELDDMVATMGTAMLGLTIGCARCHDHKFDPIPQADYYQLTSSFGLTIRSDIDIELDPEGYRVAKEKFDLEHAPLTKALTEYEQGILENNFQQWLANAAKNDLCSGAKWTTLDMVSFKSSENTELTKLEDGSILATGERPQHENYTFVAETPMRNITAVRLDALTHPSLPQGGPGRAENGNFALSEFIVKVQPLGEPDPTPVVVRMVGARATHQQNDADLSIKASIDGGSQSGWAVDNGGIGNSQSAVFDFEQPIGYPGGVRITFEMQFSNNAQHSIGRPIISLTTKTAPVSIDGERISQRASEALKSLARNSQAAALGQEQVAALKRWFAKQDPKWRMLHEAVEAHNLQEPQPRRTKVMVASEGLKPIKHNADGRGYPHFYRETYFLRRGDPSQKQGVASQQFLQVLTQAPRGAPHWQVEPPKDWRTSYRRLALADWISDTENGAGHLLARVIANRLWQHHLGRGIVATPNDLGFQGQRPTHPELLDWLAARLIRERWRLKPLHKLIMTSSVYMQSSDFDENRTKVDPSNQWYWRHSPRRLEAEAIRDAMLSVSGQLDSRMFGPGTLDESMKRRSVYFMVKRSQLIPMMQLFDSPEPLVSVGGRPATTIAPQALLFMNNPNVRQYARSAARRLKPMADESISSAVRRGYLMAIAREPTSSELHDSRRFIEQQIASYTADRNLDATELALADFCQVLMSLNEFVYID